MLHLPVLVSGNVLSSQDCWAFGTLLHHCLRNLCDAGVDLELQWQAMSNACNIACGRMDKRKRKIFMFMQECGEFVTSTSCGGGATAATEGATTDTTAGTTADSSPAPGIAPLTPTATGNVEGMLTPFPFLPIWHILH